MIFMIGITARLLGRFGAKPLIVTGLLVLAAGVAGLSLVRPDGAFASDVLPASLIAAVGMSLAYIPAMMSAMSGVRPEESGLASGIVNTTYNVGSALGLAVMTAVATSQGAAELGNLLKLTDGFQAAFVGAGVLAAGGAVLTLVLMRRPGQAVQEGPVTEKTGA
ncbi:MFS transporter, partial [Streptosporangium roseum]|uniref:MFS transporter n=1 Tax=Streptosporangium roseum TaxID=2001 RepID=UPI00331DF409